MKKVCSCGKPLIFQGGYVTGRLRVETYECYSCGNKYEKMEEGLLKKVQKQNLDTLWGINDTVQKKICRKFFRKIRS